MELMARDSENPLPVIGNGKPVGVLSREDAVTFLNTLKQLGLSIRRRASTKERNRTVPDIIKTVSVIGYLEDRWLPVLR
jgi:hypothetical protein